MLSISRRSILAGTTGAAGAALLSRPFIANAQAKSAVVWATQGFVPAEDEAFRQTVADYEKLSGNKIQLSSMPFMALNQKAISALTSGDVPDLVFHDAPTTILPQNAWNDKLVDVTDVVETQKARLTESALLNSSFFNKVLKKRAYYLCPVKQGATPFHIWGSLVTEAGFKMSDAPATWDKYWEFFKPVQDSLRKKDRRYRKIYACGLQITTVGPNDSNNLMQYFMEANGGGDYITPDGKLHLDDPKIREAAIRSVEFMSKLYTDGYVPPEALSWNDADDNNGYHEKLFVMDLDGTLSTELAWIKHEKEYWQEMMVAGYPKSNSGTEMVAGVNAGGGFIPKGAANVAVAKDFMKYFMQPEVLNKNLQGGLGRWVPPMKQIVLDDPYWLDPKDPFRKPYVELGVMGPTRALPFAFNPAYGQFAAEQQWTQCHANVIKNGMTPAQAVDKCFARANEIFAKVSFD
jgi:multiple sugar transport system substrate-binding protein